MTLKVGSLAPYPDNVLYLCGRARVDKAPTICLLPNIQ